MVILWESVRIILHIIHWFHPMIVDYFYEHLRGMGYAYFPGFLLIKVFLICRRPTPWAPANIKQ